jgi:threonine dehydrogenase-like Zn-dependent dehydrogenase
MSSRNATKNDFQEVLDKIQQKEIFPDLLITHHLLFEEVVTGFPELIKEATYIKGIIHLHESE